MSALGATSLPLRIYIKETSLCPRNTCSEIKYNKQTDGSQPKSLLLTGCTYILYLLLWQFCLKTWKMQIPSGKCSVDFILWLWSFFLCLVPPPRPKKSVREFELEKQLAVHSLSEFASIIRCTLMYHVDKSVKRILLQIPPKIQCLKYSFACEIYKLTGHTAKDRAQYARMCVCYFLTQAGSVKNLS